MCVSVSLSVSLSRTPPQQLDVTIDDELLELAKKLEEQTYRSARA